MLLACAIDHDLTEFRRHVLAPHFESVGESAVGWWDGNTKHPMPDTSASIWTLPSGGEKRDWKELVRLCAQQGESWRSDGKWCEYQIL
jgi:hypothetical protein